MKETMKSRKLLFGVFAFAVVSVVLLGAVKLLSLYTDFREGKPESEEQKIVSGSSASEGAADSSSAEASAHTVTLQIDGSIHTYDAGQLKKDNAVNTVIQELAKKYNIPAVNARINKHGKVTAEKKGKKLDINSIRSDLVTYLASDPDEDFTASYRTSKITPRWKRADLKKVNTSIGEYYTTFAPSSARGYNIKIAAARSNNVCLLPGESISYLDLLYNDTDGKKYKKAGAYYKGKSVQAEGGGICQVSSTAYIACLKAGIIPVKRYPHTAPVDYVPLGLDAALSVNNKNLIIQNTLDVPLLIRTEARQHYLIVRFKSYKNAKKGYRYVPRSVQYSKKKASSYLDVYRNKKKVRTIKLSKDKYKVSH